MRKKKKWLKDETPKVQMVFVGLIVAGISNRRFRIERWFGQIRNGENSASGGGRISERGYEHNRNREISANESWDRSADSTFKIG